jgi:hypothetical protein
VWFCGEILKFQRCDSFLCLISVSTDSDHVKFSKFCIVAIFVTVLVKDRFVQNFHVWP